MKQFKFFAFVLLGIMLSINQVWGAEVVAYTNNCPANSIANSYTTNYDVTINDITWNAPGNQYADGAWRIGGKLKSTYDRFLYSKTAISKNITKVVVTHGASSTCTVNSFKLDVYSTAEKAATGGDGDISSVSGTFKASGTTTFTRPAGKDWTGRFYRFTYNLTTNSTSSARYITPASYDFYYDNSAASTKTVVKYDANGKTLDGGSSLPTQVEATASQEYTVSTSTVSASGYTFVGWNTDKNATEKLTKVPAASMTAGGTVTLYAIWKTATPTNYTITNNLTGCTGKDDNPTSVSASDTYVTLYYKLGDGKKWPESVTVTMGGNSLTSSSQYQYYTSSDEYGTYVSIYPSSFTGNIEVTITCTDATPSSYTATYVMPKCVTSPANEETSTTTLASDVTSTLSSKYTFEGWTTNGSYESSSAKPSPLYAKGAAVPATGSYYPVFSYSKTTKSISTVDFSINKTGSVTSGSWVIIANGQSGAYTQYVVGGQEQLETYSASGTNYSYIHGYATTGTSNADVMHVNSTSSVYYVTGDNTNGWTFKNYANGKYLGISNNGTNNQLTLSDAAESDYEKWTITQVGSGQQFYIQNKGDNNYYLNYVSDAKTSTYYWNVSNGTLNTNNQEYLFYVSINPCFDEERTYTISPSCGTFGVTYSAGTGSGSVPTDATEYAGNSLVTVLFDPLPTKTGYTWSGWTDGDDAHPYSPEDGGYKNFLITGNTTLTAMWTANTYTVHYNGNGSTGGSTANSSHTYGTAKNLTQNGFTRTGYKFAGWATTESGAVAYADKASVTNLTATNGATVQLYAVWTPITYTLAYDANGGTGTMTDSNSPYNYNAEVTVLANAFTAPAGKKFNGWKTGASSGTSYAAGATFNITANTTLYAQWTDITYTDYITECSSEITLTYNMNGHGTQIEPVSPATVIVIPSPAPTETGYTFGGWYTNADLAAGHEAVAGTAISENTTLYAKWTVNQHTLTWSTDGDALTGTYTSGTVNYGAAITAPNTPTKTGYNFAGWSDGSSVVTPATTMPDNNLTYTATWTAKVYDHFYVNGVEVDAYKTEHTGGVVTFPAENPTSCDAENYPSFVGWAATDFGTTTTAPTLISDGATRDAGNYYAVFAKGTAGASGTVTMNASGLSTATYKEGTKTDDKGNTWSYYASVNNLSGTLYYGLNLNASNYNIGSPVLPGNVTGIAIKAYNGSSSATRSLYICSSNSTAQPTSGDLAEISVAKSEQFTNTYNADLSSAGSFKQFYIYAAAALGVSEVKVTYEGTPNFTEWITRCCEAPGTELSISGNATVAYNTDLTLTAAGGNGGTVNWSVAPSANTSITATGATTTFRATKKGTYTITASQEKNGSVCATEATKEVTVTAALSSIAVNGQTTTFYVTQGFTFDGTCTATYADGSTATVTPTSTSVNVTTPFAATGSGTATISYTEGGVTKTTTYSITIETAPTYTITLNPGTGTLAGGATSPVVVLQSSATTTLPSCDQTCDEGGTWTFAGWSDKEVSDETTTAPDFVATAADLSYTATKDVTLYAVYKRVTEKAGTGEAKTSTFNIMASSGPTGGSPWTAADGSVWTYSKLTIASTNYGFRNDGGHLDVTLPEKATPSKIVLSATSNGSGWATNVQLALTTGSTNIYTLTGVAQAGTSIALSSYSDKKSFALDCSGGASSKVAYVGKVVIHYTLPGEEITYCSVPCGRTYSVTLNPGAGNKVTIETVEYDTYTYSNQDNGTVITLPVESAMVYDNSEWEFAGWTADASFGAQAEPITTIPTLTGATYAVNSADVTLYAVYKQTPPDDTFDGTATVEDVKMYMKNGVAYKYAKADFGITKAHKFGATTDCRNEASTFDLVKVGENEFQIKPHNVADKYLIQSGSNDLQWISTASSWHFATGTQNGPWRVTFGAAKSHALSGSWTANSFADYGDQIDNSPGLYFEVGFGECQEPVYTNNPSNKAQISMRATDATATGLVTSTNGETTFAPGTYTISAVGLKASQKVWVSGEKLAFYNNEGTLLTLDNSKRLVGTTDANGVLAATVIRIGYAPNTTATEYTTEQLTVTFTSKDAENADYEKPYLNCITGRNLPAKFVIAQKVGEEWYALPNNMTTTAGNPAGVKISVNEATHTATVRATSENYLGWTLEMTTQATQKHTIEFASAADSKYLATASSEASTLSQMSAQTGTNQARTEFVPATEDLVDYTLKRNGWVRYLGLRSTEKDWGVFSTENKVRFFSYTMIAPTTDVTFDPNTGDANGCTGYQQLEYGTSPAVCHSQTRTGYTFDGYTVTKNGTDYVFNQDGEMQSGVTGYTDASGKWSYTGETATLYAHWTPIEYTITYENTKGADNSSNPTKYTIESETINFTALPNVTGYTFTGWSPASIATGTTGNQTITASWNTNQHTLTWDFAGGATTTADGAYTHGTIDYGTTITAPADPTKTGYTFNGWSADVPATMPDNDVTITATFAPITYEVRYNGNGNTSGSMDNTSFTYDKAGNLRTNTFTKTGYDFAGWATTADGAKVYDDKAEVINLATTQGAVVDLYAKWNAKTINITWDAATNGGTIGGNGTKVTPYTYDGANVVLPTPDARTGYTFKGWFVSATGTTQVTEVGTTRKPTTDQIYYAQWSVNDYTIVLDKNNSDAGSMDGSVKFTYGTSAYKTFTAATRTGYTLNGYYATSAATGTMVLNANGTIANNLTNWVVDGKWIQTDESAKLYAKWTANTYYVEYNDNGKTGGSAMTNSTFRYGTEYNLKTNTYKKTGYTFAGWSTVQNGAVVYTDGQSVSNLTAENGATVILYAKWTPITYQVAYDGNGKTGGSMDNTTFKYDEAKTLRKNDYTRDGYSFDGWATTAEGAVAYTDQQSVSNLTTTDGATVTLYAHWTKQFGTLSATADVHLTSGNGIQVYTTQDANFVTVSCDKLGAANSIKIEYLDESDNVVEKGSSLFRLCYAPGHEGGNTAYTVADGTNIPLSAEEKAAVSYSRKFAISYTPTAAGVTNVAKIRFTAVTAKPSDLGSATVTLNGRSLPEKFAIVMKNDGDKNWYALPNDLDVATSAASSTKAPLLIEVDNTTTPTKVAYAPTNAAYEANGRYEANSHRGAIRFLQYGAGSNAWITTSSTSQLYMPNNGADKQQFNLTSSNFSDYLIEQDDATGYRISMVGGTIGWYNTGSNTKVYLLPIDELVTMKEADVIEWGANGLVAEVDATGVDGLAVTVDGKTVEGLSMTQTTTSAGSATKYDYTFNFGDDLSLTDKADKVMYLKWMNGASVAGVTIVKVPRIISGEVTVSTAGQTKTEWLNYENIVVLPGAKLTVDGATTGFVNPTLKKVEVYPGGKLYISSGTVQTNTLILRAGWSSNKQWAHPMVAIASSATLTKTNAYLDWYVDYHQYYPIAVPFPVTVANMSYVNTKSSAASGVTFKQYDGAQRATEGQTSVGKNWKAITPETLTPSTGYAMTARRPAGKAWSIVRMPLTFTDAWSTGGEQAAVGGTAKNVVFVTAYGVGGEQPWYCQGWNFVANPFMVTFASSDEGFTGKLQMQNGGSVRYATIPTMDFQDYYQVPIAGANLQPMSGFFVQVGTTGNMEFVKGGQQSLAPMRAMATETGLEAEGYIRLTGNDQQDMMGLLIADEYTAGNDFNADLPKVLGSANTLKTYMVYNSQDMAYVALNESLAQQQIPVTVRIPAAGEYTFSLDENLSAVADLDALYLTDFTTGFVTNLLEQDYSFNALAGVITDRFVLNAVRQQPHSPTDLDDVGTGKKLHDVKKIIYHNKLYIIVDGSRVYDATGRDVKDLK